MIGSRYPKSCACVSGSLAAQSFFLMIFAILEKQRWTPFYRQMKCDPSEPFALPMSKMSPSPFVAAMMGMPAGLPPYGVYFNLTNAATCRNPNQVVITMKAQGSKVEMFAPNLTDLALGGRGLPFALTGQGRLSSDVHLAAGGGTAEIAQSIQVEFPESAMLAMMGSAAVQGYAPLYVKSIMPTESCTTVFGLTMCQDTVAEQWCGSFGGNCLVKAKGNDGQPLEPVQFVPAMCTMTKAICGAQEDMQAELTPSAVGLEIVGTILCPPSSGLPNGTRCNVVRGPGVDSTTLEPKIIDPPSQLTTRAQQEMDKQLAAGETMITAMTVGAAVVGALSGTFWLAMSIIYCRRVHSTRPAEAQEAMPTILNSKPTAATKETSASMSV